MTALQPEAQDEDGAAATVLQVLRRARHALGHPEIERETGLSRDEVDEAIKCLEEAGAVMAEYVDGWQFRPRTAADGLAATARVALGVVSFAGATLGWSRQWRPTHNMGGASLSALLIEQLRDLGLVEIREVGGYTTARCTHKGLHAARVILGAPGG